GIVRVSKMDSDGGLEFVGEDKIDHTPKDEKVRVLLGSAFDVVGSRTQTNIKKISDKVREETYKLEVRNRKEEAVEVNVVEHLWGYSQWEITSASSKYSKTDSQTVEFLAKIPAGGTATVTYTVRYSW
ncbi:MAG: DUF4139 domain-containing protein, partial [Clostridia bacterium]|nr:DUF4139 domain-containing protein [Clostridia bacterium]